MPRHAFGDQRLSALPLRFFHPPVHAHWTLSMRTGQPGYLKATRLRCSRFCLPGASSSRTPTLIWAHTSASHRVVQSSGASIQLTPSTSELTINECHCNHSNHHCYAHSLRNLQQMIILKCNMWMVALQSLDRKTLRCYICVGAHGLKWVRPRGVRSLATYRSSTSPSAHLC